ncbi:MAG: cytochrome c maturation protein CcmE [Chloroflexota bacterium]|nr:cytochrome c maturation protein CcmE [Chloroflexota bacterium]
MSSIAAPSLERTATAKAGGKWKFVIGGLLILGAIAYVTLSSFQSNAIYYLTLQELNAQRTALIGQPVRVNAPLDKASIQFDDKTLTLKFNLGDGNLVLPVVYKGVVPDTLGQGESVVAEGRLGADGVFQASTILVKCPSKYESQPTDSTPK